MPVHEDEQPVHEDEQPVQEDVQPVQEDVTYDRPILLDDEQIARGDKKPVQVLMKRKRPVVLDDRVERDAIPDMCYQSSVSIIACDSRIKLADSNTTCFVISCLCRILRDTG